MNNGCRQGRHAHAHSGARVVGRDVGCGWVGLGIELDFCFLSSTFAKRILYFSYTDFFSFLFAREILFHSRKDCFARIFCTFF